MIAVIIAVSLLPADALQTYTMEDIYRGYVAMRNGVSVQPDSYTPAIVMGRRMSMWTVAIVSYYSTPSCKTGQQNYSSFNFMDPLTYEHCLGGLCVEKRCVCNETYTGDHCETTTLNCMLFECYLLKNNYFPCFCSRQEKFEKPTLGEFWYDDGVSHQKKIFPPYDLTTRFPDLEHVKITPLVETFDMPENIGFGPFGEAITHPRIQGSKSQSGTGPKSGGKTTTEMDIFDLLTLRYLTIPSGVTDITLNMEVKVVGGIESISKSPVEGLQNPYDIFRGDKPPAGGKEDFEEDFARMICSNKILILALIPGLFITSTQFIHFVD